MRLALVGFALGTALLQIQPSLPANPTTACVVGAGALVLWLSTRLPRAWLSAFAAFIGAGVLGFAWATLCADARLADTLADNWEGRDVALTGVIASLPQSFDRGVRFEFEVERVNTAGARIPQRLQITWYSSYDNNSDAPVPEVHAGERWTLTARLRKPHGNANPHTFDYEAWLLERGIRATGYVRVGRGSAAPSLLAPNTWSVNSMVNSLRERIREHLRRALGDAPYAGVIIALAIGDQRAIDADDWQIFTRTGVSHLMSISGLHVTMVASLAAWAVFALWRASVRWSPRLMLLLPAPKAAALGGFLAAFAYCLLAGFAIPAQRTLYMLGVAAYAIWRIHWLRTALIAQLAITLGLVPLTLALFQQVSLVAPLANAVAIPLVSLVITPLALLAAVLPFDVIAHLAHALQSGLMVYLEWLGGFNWAVWQQAAPPLSLVVLAAVGALWMLVPWWWSWRTLGLVWMLPLFLHAPPPLPEGSVKMTVLDVGQGLAVIAQTSKHALLFDTGPAYSPEADGGNRVVIPFLRGEGITRLDGMIVSHDDNDHSGGALSVLDAVPVGWLASSLPQGNTVLATAGPRARRCEAGQQWEWDGVRFEFLHPQASDYTNAAARDNAQSCVLKITAHGRSLLLPADAERDVEERQLRTQAASLRSDVLIAPHHGSNTSSTAPWIAAVQPSTVIFPVGYRNRFRHPAVEVVQRYEASGARLLRTDSMGAVTVRVDDAGTAITTYRADKPRYWYGR